MKVVILAGGLGTRMRGTLGDLPKPLAPIGGRPFIEYLLKFISNQQFRDVIISLGHGADAIREYLGDGSSLGLRVEYTVERDLLGTGGAVKRSEPLIKSDDFFVMNGDTYFEVDMGAMLRFHRGHAAFATMALAHKDDTRRYGRVVFDSGNRITAFAEKVADKMSGFINGGMYIFRREVFDHIPEGVSCSLEQDIVPLLVGKGLYGFPVDGYFVDVGVPTDYERAKKEIPLRGAL